MPVPFLIPECHISGFVEQSWYHLTMEVLPDVEAGRCPACGQVSRSVHSLYRRHPADLPASASRATPSIAVRRFAGRTSAATMRANQLRLWFACMAHVLLCVLRRIGPRQTGFAEATCGTIRARLLKIDALVITSARRVEVAMASGRPWQAEWTLAQPRSARAAA